MMGSYLASAVLGGYKNIRETIRCFLGVIVLAAILISVPQRGYATDWVPISGQIQFEGAPVCALVLANGQHIFSCNGNGAYNLTVPLDTNGTITLFAFASGFAPFKQVLTSGEAAIYNVGMVRSDTSRELEITQVITPGTDGWVNISGSVKYNGAPVCAMALANGQHMFTCGDNLGRFSMSVPLDSTGNITLYNFVSGFAPSKEIMNGSGYTDAGCTGDVYGCLTISGDSQVPSTFTPDRNEVSIGGGGVFGDSFQGSWSDSNGDYWSIIATIIDNYEGLTGSQIVFKPFLGTTITSYTCESGFLGSAGDCGGATVDPSTRTVTFSNVQLQGPGLGAVITLNGTLKY